MSWGIREWSVRSGRDWVIVVDRAKGLDDVRQAIDLMLQNGRPQIDVFFGPLVMEAPKELTPDGLIEEEEPYRHEVSLSSGASYTKGMLQDLMGWLDEKLERDCQATVFAEWSDIEDDANERRLRIQKPGALSRPSALA